jgi:hypothetical protein
VSGPPPSTATPPPPGSGELWQVRLGDGQVRSGTRQQLEEAFNAGHLDEGALVLAAGAHEWVTLASLGRRRSSEPAPAPAPDVAAEVQPAASVLAPQQTPVTVSEQAPAAPAPDASSPLPAQDGQADSQAGWGGDQIWHVKLAGRQLERVFHAGLLDDDALVLAPGTDEWVPLGDVRQAQSAAPGTPPAMQSGHDGTATNGAIAVAPGASLQEPASQTDHAQQQQAHPNAME